ncbi:SDR family mycofactocin-dependent oxidoreductase [Nocardioides alpinus]|uniref:SDR family mycofactocin-dependent oxidoreductase n=1 Tax=Nocardioides alpinus TaxID=748909 RepID=A0A1I1AW32_9ACTN|nr:mycofactocin-coupled SDR family oxidoreductase [Nocardioides alpinus]PKH40943.1 SDR family mycofactocin-dependent oxidoreductase [Nocardioides alpinus]SFB42244.1 SDR family mycofactocin-dependent oxidoreductase [Nocardioides alpinus]
MTPTRVALVTGAARGIGAATVDRLVADGCHVVALDSCGGGGLATRADLDGVGARHGDRVLPVVADVRDRAALDGAVALAVDRWGRLDAAVAAAAVIRGGTPLWQTPEADLDELWDVDVRGVWHTAAATVPAMLAGPDPSGCRFVAVASAAGTRGLFHLAAYTAAKHAVVGMVKGLAADLVGTGVTANAVSPGSTDTAMLAATAALYDVPADELAGHQLLQRLLDPGEVAAAIAFCASPAGGVVNGTVLHADGGFTG